MWITSWRSGGRLLVLLLTLLLNHAAQSDAARPPKFKKQGLFEVPSGLESENAQAVAFGDFNADKYTDVFMLTNNDNELLLFLWNQRELAFVNTPIDMKFDYKIKNVIPQDFNRDGALDVLVVGEDTSQKGKMSLKIFFGNGLNSLNRTTVLTLPPAIGPEPFVLDYFGEMRSDLMGYPFDSPDKLSIWRINDNQTVEVVPARLVDTASGKTACKLSTPHSSGFVDLNGDCLADIFLTCDNKDSHSNTAQIWLNQKSGYRLGAEKELTKGSGQISFADIEGDCAKPNNAQCISRDKFDLSYGHTPIDFESILPKEVIVLETKGARLPLPLQIGDYNKDGYPDILLITSNKDDSSKTHIRLLESVPCTKSLCSKEDVEQKRRYFIAVSLGMPALTSGEAHSLNAVFFDFMEDGTLDIMKITTDKGRLQSKVVLNNVFSDALFLKSLGR
ncbi:hypothetical protein HDV05_001304 [Chytridiales sp. JEL 0842]|nr:hypothetical protein HDV05_001304 [Chytridiales sp. JEL 0842]